VEIIINVTFKGEMIFINKFKGIVEVKIRVTKFRLKFVMLAKSKMGFNG
jgi:hypothetical protein